MSAYQKFRDEIDGLRWRKNKPLGPILQKVDNILDCARINADDTVYLEKSLPATDWQKIATDSVAGQLCYEKDLRVLGWFQKRGFKW